MNVNRVIQAPAGDALATLRAFLADWWRSYSLQALLAPVEDNLHHTLVLKAIDDPAELALVNPFAPLMPGNAAAAIAEFAQRQQGRRGAVMLRPCEMRTLAELRSQGRLPAAANSLITLGVDCLGTFPAETYARRVQAHGAPAVTREALTYADEGGFSPQEFRVACQVCSWPAPHGADVTLGVLGTHGGQALLLIARDAGVDSRLNLGAVAPALATEPQVARRETAVGGVEDLRRHARARLESADHDGQRFSDLGHLLAWFNTCSLCGDCLDACPLYNGELSGLLGVHGGRPPLAELVRVSHWLASCSGCGMCEAACEQHVPLMRLISSLSHQIQADVRHRAGGPARHLPLAGD